jgi:hypothetical protein
MPMPMTLAELRTEVGHFLGYGGNSANWDSSQTADVTRCVEMGLRQFYSARAWNFLRLIAEIPTVVNTQVYTFPSTVSSLVGDIAYPLEGRSRSIRIVGNIQWKELTNHDPERTGPPSLGTVRQLAVSGATPQAQALVIWPKPDAVYMMEYQFLVAPNKLAANNDVPYGADVHSLTILQSMLAYAERRLGDSQNVQSAAYERALMDSIRMDAETRRPNWFGYNGDRSEQSLFTPSRVRGLVTVQGQEPE